MYFVLIIFAIVAIWMQTKSNQKNSQVYEKTNGVIKSRQDLMAVKDAINLSMKLAVVYIGMFVLFIVLLALFVARGTSLGHAALSLFIFGIITLPVGLIGKRFEKKIKTMQVQANPEIAEEFQQYLKQWNEVRFKLPE